jgi:integrase
MQKRSRSLRGHRKRQAAGQLAAGPLWRGTNDQVFAAADGAPLYPDSVSALTGTLARRSVLPASRLHDLRHLHATTLLLPGVPVHVVAARLGHADPASTLRVYANCPAGAGSRCRGRFRTRGCGLDLSVTSAGAYARDQFQ